MMFALWSCTLYLMLPETKARYAVYTFLGFLPLLEVAVAAKEGSRVRARAVAEIVLCLVLIGGLVPEPVTVYGMGFIGAFGLWLLNLQALGSGLPTPGFGQSLESGA